MNIIHIVSSSNYIPETGIHTYVTDLCNTLDKSGFKNTILIIKEKSGDLQIVDNSVEYLLSSNPDFKQQLLNISQKHNATYFHFHSVFPFQLFNEILTVLRNTTVKTVLTIHNNSLLCYKGNMAFKNKTFCTQNGSNMRCLTCLADRHKFSVPIFFLNVANSFLKVTTHDKLNYIKLLDNFRTNVSELMRNIDEVVVLDQWVLDFLPKKIGLLTSVTHIQQAIKPNDPLKKEPMPKGKEIKLVYIGRTDVTKGLLILVKALKNLKNVKLDCYIDVTDQLYYEQILKIVSNNRLNVHFYASIQHHKINEVLSSYDMLCLPSFSEMAPMLSLEALDFGIPIIASDHPSFVSQSKLNSGILLFKNGNTSSLNEKLKKVIAHGFSIASNNSDYDALLSKHVKLYNQF